MTKPMSPKQKLVMKGLRDFVKQTTPAVVKKQHAEIEAFKRRLSPTRSKP